MNQTINDLRNDIKSDMETLKGKKEVLEVLEAAEKKNRPFSHTTVGGILFKGARFLTSGFASMHGSLDESLRSPFKVQADKLAARATKLLSKAEKLNREGDEKGSNKMALRLAELVMDTEDFLERHDNFCSEVLEPNLKAMHTEVERLRPPRDEQKAMNLKEQIETGFANAPAGV